jgi:hypothetical protein
MKNRKRDIIFLFIATTPVSAWMIYWFIWEEEYNLLPCALLPQGVMALCIGIMILQEKHVLKRESELLHSDFPKKWDYALEKYENSDHSNIRSESMTKHLKKIYRIRLFPLCFFYGLLSIAALLAFYISWKSSKDNKYIAPPSLKAKICVIFFAIFGTGCILTAIYQFCGLPVYLFLKKHRTDAEAIERSYMEGKMIYGKLSGINVGFEYCVCYDLFSVSCFNVRNIEYAETFRKIKKEKSTSGFYHKVKQDISVKINIKGEKNPYSISLNEQQLEYLCDELKRRGVQIINNN